MLQQITEYLMNVALRHKAVNEAEYKKRSYINQQNNGGYLRFVVEDNPYAQWIKTSNVFTITWNLDVLAFPKDDTEVLSMQSLCFQVINEIIAYIKQDKTFQGQLDVWDYNYLGVSHYTDDSSCGQRCSLELVVPDPIALCSFLDNFSDEVEVVEKPTLDLTQADKAVLSENKKTLNLKPIKLKTKQ